MRHLKLPRIQILDGWKNKVAVFFTKKTHFQPFFFLSKTLRKHYRNLVKPINGIQKCNKQPQNPKAT